MIIANPIYDVVFKYLLEDSEIAKELLSTILGATIIKLDVKPQETLISNETGEVKIFHLDFKALVEMADGEQRTVLIELQKAKKSYDILRFRKYLGVNYLKEEVRKNPKGELESYAIEIVTIYILGFKLEGVDLPVLKVSRKYTDAITKEEVIANNEFISKLTHESYTIQIPRLKHEQRNKLEEVLEIFNQDFVTDDLHNINFPKTSNDPLVKKMIKRLSKAAANEKIKRTMEAEDSIERMINRETEEKTKELNEVILQKDEALLQKDEALLQKEEVILQKDDEIEKLKKMIEKLKKI
jgi:hypothetical protein